MKKVLASFAALLILAVPVVAFADVAIPSQASALPTSSLLTIFESILTWAMSVIAIVGVLGFIIAGILYLTAAGDETRIGTAKKAMLYSIVGIIVGLAGGLAITVVNSLLGGSSTF